MVGYEDPTFYIKGGDMGFADRQKNIFDLLTVAEKEKNERQSKPDVEMECENSGKSNDNTVISRKRSRSQMKQFRGKESIFKKPDVQPYRFKDKDNIPDHRKNPHKWIKYSLADVSQDDMSDRSNTAAALSFLKEMEQRKESIEMQVEILPSEITFKQPRNKSKLLVHHDSTVNIVAESSNMIDEDEKPSFRSTKLVMPEYVVGMTKKKEKKKSQKCDRLLKNETVTSGITLHHLIEEDE
ncbi:hypothetical protein L9F63_013719 [Diploptera punctata]|uniref:U5 small nuclear ribonucleoprotein TSSC4 n=1 Tax=Diploptera punctata TaxID=6984 RepID=A0AAD8A9N3_DIPPU|nr:hypothetical protein L9F63_013719 [Diploptera punctata]